MLLIRFDKVYINRDAVIMVRPSWGIGEYTDGSIVTVIELSSGKACGVRQSVEMVVKALKYGNLDE